MQKHYLYFLREFLSRCRKKFPALFFYIFKKYILSFGDRKLKFPHTVMIRLSGENNFNLSYCGMWSEAIRKYSTRDFLLEKIPVESWIKVINDLRKYKPYVFLDGGEPLLYPGIELLIEHINKSNLLAGLRTDGTKIDDFKNDLMKLDFLLINLDGNERINQEITGSKKAFSKTVGGIKSLLEERARSRRFRPLIQMTTSILKKNQGILFEMAELAQSLEVDIFCISLPILASEKAISEYNNIMKESLGINSSLWNYYNATFTEEEISKILKQINRIKKNKWDFELKILPSIKVKNIRGYLKGQSAEENNKCLLPKRVACIFPNGDVCPCWDHPDISVGNVLKDNLYSIWNSSSMEKFRIGIDTNELRVCRQCHGLFEK